MTTGVHASEKKKKKKKGKEESRDQRGGVGLAAYSTCRALREDAGCGRLGRIPPGRSAAILFSYLTVLKSVLALGLQISLN
jgi:hypothetical protein